jgi:DNA-binding MarR family transcriptional regulator
MSPETTKCNYFALRQAMRSASSLYERHLAKVSLTTPQFSILRAISTKPGIDMQALAETMVMDRTSLLRALKPLTRDGYVVQRPSDIHPRKQVMSLTTSGMAKFEEGRPHWRAAQDEFEDAVGADHARELREALMSLTDKMPDH